jgi:uncharacterized membrane protein
MPPWKLALILTAAPLAILGAIAIALAASSDAENARSTLDALGVVAVFLATGAVLWTVFFALDRLMVARRQRRARRTDCVP